MVRSVKITAVIVFLILYCILASAGASVTFGVNPFIEAGIAAICLFYFSSSNLIRTTNATMIAAVLVVLAVAYTIRGGNIAGYIGRIMSVSLAVVILNLRNDCRIILLQKVCQWFSILLVISLAVWAIHFFIPLPHSTAIEEGTRNYLIHNYFFFKEFDASYFDSPIPRFQSVFKEPGHLGTIMTFFLMANRFNFKKKECIVFLICAVLSLSSSAYVLTALGYLLFKFSENGSKKLIVAGIFILSLILFFMYYNGGDNVVNNLIFSKLNREEGAVQSRVSLEVLSIYESMWSSGENLLFGNGIFDTDDVYVGAGLILYFVQHGIVGTLLLFIAYYSIFASCKSRYGLFVFIVYLVSFLQRTYPFWDAFILPFILGLPYYRYIEEGAMIPNRKK